MNVQYSWVLVLLSHFGGRQLRNEVLFLFFSRLRCILILLKKKSEHWDNQENLFPFESSTIPVVMRCIWFPAFTYISAG